MSPSIPHLPAPEPWLQYGALGLLALVLCGFGIIAVIGGRAVMNLVREILVAVRELTSEIADLKSAFGRELAELRGFQRAKLDSIEHDVSRKRSDRPEPHRCEPRPKPPTSISDSHLAAVRQP